MPLYIETVGRVVCDHPGCKAELVVEDEASYPKVLLAITRAGWMWSSSLELAACPERKEEMRAKQAP